MKRRARHSGPVDVPTARRGSSRKPRVLFVGRTRYRLPLEGGLARKWDALSDQMEVRAIAAGTGFDPRFRLVRPRPLDGPRFYAGLPFRVAREIRSFDPDAVVAETPYEGIAIELARRLARVPARTVVEVHGDWRTSTRLYGSSLRRVIAPLGDRLAAWGIRRADAVRTLSPFTSGLVRGLGVEPAGEFVAFVDLGLFDGAPPAPLPSRPAALFVGVLELYKNVDGLVAAWRLAAPRVPEARLAIVGEGSRSELVRELCRDLPRRAEWTPRLTPAEVAAALDGSTCLLLPSRSEGLPRIAVEALWRGRAVVATRGGGIPDIVQDGVNGLLVEPGDTAGLAEALVRVLTDAELAERLARGAHEASARWRSSPEQFAESMRAVVDRALAR
jgi:glycosyltransferase involved in cell wall biosynthesis